ncbi:MAG TPA: saccharopine dehydrogenase C-terminal domain-containing protein [Phycisphaerae bacterium]|nr:saccharopine dehydrogenase C-terminal domain-containing protein [Phycisphaerae bacterium]
MARFLVLGAGRQGVACGTYLLERQPDTQVVYGDVSPERLGSVRDQASHPQRVSTNLIDVGRNEQELEALIADCDCVISCVPFFFNEGLTRLAIRRGKHFCDLGGNVDTVRRQLAIADAAREAGVCVVPDCGLAPGTVNVLAELWRDRWQYRSVKILCGGLPQHPKGILGYQANFSIHGLLNEYLDDCQVARGGQVLTIPGLSELERVSGLAVPGEFEAFATSGGASLGPELYAPLGIDYEYKTLRYPGHRDAIMAMAEVGLFEQRPLRELIESQPCEATASAALPEICPRDMAVALLERAFASDRQDLVIARVEVQGTDEHGRPIEGRADLLDRADGRFTAMERTTGFSVGVVAAFLAGLLPEKPPTGVYVPSQVMPAKRLIAELDEVGVKIVVRP